MPNSIKRFLTSGLLSGISVIGLISCSPKQEPDAWSGPRIKLLRNQGGILSALDVSQDQMSLSDEVRVFSSSSADDFSTPGDSSVTQVEVTSSCRYPGRPVRIGRQSSLPNNSFRLRDLIAPEILPPHKNLRSWEKYIECQFNLRFFNEVGSSRSRSLPYIKISLETGLVDGSLGLDQVNQPPVHGATTLHLVCSIESATEELNSFTPVSEVMATLIAKVQERYAAAKLPSPNQFCRFIGKTQRLETFISESQIISFSAPTAESKLTSRFNESLPDISTHVLRAFLGKSQIQLPGTCPTDFQNFEQMANLSPLF